MRRALIALALLSPAAASAQKLEKFEKQFEGDSPRVQTAEKTTRSAAEKLDSDPDTADASDNAFVVVALIPFLPYSYALNQGRQPLSLPPYASKEVDTVQRLDAVFQRVSNDVKGLGARYSLESSNGLGLAGSWTSYRERGTGEDLHHFEASAFADVWRGESSTGRYALGFGGLSGRRTRAGPRISLGGEWRPLKPLFLEASSAVTALEGGALGDLRVAAGLCFWRLQPWIGYRWLVGPLAELSGPEIGLSARF
jgi:hypothetical protein